MEFKDLLREIEVPRELMVEAAKTTIKEIRAAQIKHRWRVAYATAIPVLGGAFSPSVGTDSPFGRQAP